jgi:RimJ/RimL family protein N-acetyltransferase
MAAATGRWAYPRADGDRVALRPAAADEPGQDERIVLSIVDLLTGEEASDAVLGDYDAERESAALRVTLRGPTGERHELLDEAVRRMVDHGLRTLGLARITVDVPDRDRRTVEASRLEPDYPIVTERLLLRPLDAETDVAAMHAYRSREDVCEYEPYVPGTLEEMAERFRDPERIRSVIDAEGQKLILAIERRDTGAMVGDLMLLWHSVANGHAEVGYVLHPDHGGQGFATEATAALIDLAFDGGLPVRRVTVRTDVLNERSAALSRRLGLRHEATLVESEWFKGGWSSLLEFAVLDHEWRARR